LSNSFACPKLINWEQVISPLQVKWLLPFQRQTWFIFSFDSFNTLNYLGTPKFFRVIDMLQGFKKQKPDSENRTNHLQILLLLRADELSLYTVAPALMSSLCWLSHATTPSTPVGLCCLGKTEEPSDLITMSPITILS